MHRWIAILWDKLPGVQRYQYADGGGSYEGESLTLYLPGFHEVMFWKLNLLPSLTGQS